MSSNVSTQSTSIPRYNDASYIWFIMDNLQTRDIPKAKLPVGYTVHTWKDVPQSEEIWFNIVKEAFEPEFQQRWNIDGFKETYQKKPQFTEDGFYFIKNQNRYIGTAFAWQDEQHSEQGRLNWVAVVPEEQGKGIGKALCYLVLQYFKDQGKLRALVKTRHFRQTSITLYKKVGFSLVNEDN